MKTIVFLKENYECSRLFNGLLSVPDDWSIDERIKAYQTWRNTVFVPSEFGVWNSVARKKVYGTVKDMSFFEWCLAHGAAEVEYEEYEL
jgi:hypothetical protein